MRTEPMETLSEAIARLQAAGYTESLSATLDGRLRCPTCGGEHDPADVEIDEQVRFEGTSDPDDESILVALTCGCGAKGLYTTMFGPEISGEDATVVRRLPRG
ncbi:MAG: hypothetical protein U5K30_07300 [Acidimicrobiales bacterium]|nr:hypothetical protein [Acidimicrobiales bacterium]